MRRGARAVKRKRAVVLAVTGAVLSLTIGSAWLWTCWRGGTTYRVVGSSTLGFWCSYGAIGFEWYDRTIPFAASDRWPVFSHSGILRDMYWWPRVWFYKGSAHLLVPLWMPWLFASASSGLLIWRVARRRPASACRTCGYSLVGLTAGAACPECGKGAPGDETP